MRKLARIATLSSAMWLSAISVTLAADPPDRAPAGYRWMGCWAELLFPNYSQKMVIAGYWLAKIPDESAARTAKVKELEAQWLEEYGPVLSSTYPPYKSIRTGCVAWQDRSEFRAYSAWAKSSAAVADRSDFVPSFAEEFVPSKGDASGN